MPSKNAPIYQFKISLNHTHPPIWRRIQVPAILRLGRLHDIIQVVMGWTDSHLHRFEVDGVDYSDPDFNEYGDMADEDEWEVRLKDLDLKVGEKIRYEYDFGDSWEHKGVLEKILPPDPKMRHPVCLGGARACPPEDVGGVIGYEHFLEAIRNPQDEHHEEYMEWGGPFDPDFFDLEEVNRQLRRLKNRETLDSSDWAYDPEVLRPALPEKVVDAAWLRALDDQFGAEARSLALRRDMLIFLDYLLVNRVVGTQSTGNLPVKDGETICASLSKPISFQEQVGERLFKIQSCSEVWALQLLHVLTSCAGWAQGGPGRRWKVTDAGVEFQQLPEAAQVWEMCLTWWTKVNWGIAANYGPASYPTQYIRPIVLKLLLKIPEDKYLPFEMFADQLMAFFGPAPIQATGMDQRRSFHSDVQSIVAEPLRDLGVLVLGSIPHPLLGADYPILMEMKVTPLGREMLQRLEQDGIIETE